MLWLKKDFIVERKVREDGLHEFVVSKGNKIINTVIPDSEEEEMQILNMLESGNDIHKLLIKKEPILKEKKDIPIGEIVEVIKPSLLMLHFIPFDMFNYLNSHGGKVGEVVNRTGHKRSILEIQVNELENNIFINENYVRVVNNQYVRRVYENEKRKLLNHQGSGR